MRISNFRINAGCTHTQQIGCVVDEAKSNTADINASENNSSIGEGLVPGWIPYGLTVGASLVPRKLKSE